jgi:hypothetical protein
MKIIPRTPEPRLELACASYRADRAVQITKATSIPAELTSMMGRLPQLSTKKLKKTLVTRLNEVNAPLINNYLFASLIPMLSMIRFK